MQTATERWSSDEPAKVRPPNLAHLLDVGPAGDDAFDGAPYPEWGGGIYGGLLVAQALVAAARTAPESRTPHSLQARFLRAGASDAPAGYRVKRLLDGRSFAARHVTAAQGERVLFDATVSFHTPEFGVEYRPSRPDAPRPEDTPHLAESLDGAEPAARGWIDELSRRIPIEVRFPEEPPHLVAAREGTAPPRQRFWMRPHQPLTADPLTHAAALAYVSDCFLLSSALPPHRRGLSDVRFASLDHVLWLHGRVRFDDWLLYEQSGQWAGAGRALCQGKIFDRDGVLVATVMQEGLVRT